MGLFGRKRMKTTDAQGRKVVVVTDKRGTVRKTKIKDKKNQITTKERYDRAGNLNKRKAKGKYIKRFKAKTSNPTFDQSVFQGNTQIKNMVSGNPILNAKRNDMLNNGTDTQKNVQNTQIKNDTTQTKKTETNTVDETKKVNVSDNKNTTDTNTKDTKKTEKSFGDAYREQRNKNTEAGIDHYGDDGGYFTWKGKKYNTESAEEKAERTKIVAPEPVIDKVETTPTPTTDPTITPDNDNSTPPINDDIQGIDKNNTPPGTVGPGNPTDSITAPDLTKIDMDTIAKRGGSKGSYRSYKHGGAVGPNGIL